MKPKTEANTKLHLIDAYHYKGALCFLVANAKREIL